MIVTEFKIDYGYKLQDANTSYMTCTVLGQNDHLVWLFTGFHVDYQANHLLYFVLCVISFMFYKRDLISIPISWFLTLFITYFVAQVSHAELPAYWCLLSVISTVINLGFSFYDKE